MSLEEDGRNVLTENSQASELNQNGVGIPTLDPGVAASHSVQVSDTGIASHEHLEFVMKRDFELQMSNLQMAFSQFQSNIMTVLPLSQVNLEGCRALIGLQLLQIWLFVLRYQHNMFSRVRLILGIPCGATKRLQLLQLLLDLLK